MCSLCSFVAIDSVITAKHAHFLRFLRLLAAKHWEKVA
jgi:hypothetical protein